MVDAIGDILTYVLLILAGFLVWAALSPFEVMGWWAGWFGDKIHDDHVPPDGLVRMVRANRDSYVVFFSGVGRVSGETLSFREQVFLRKLATALPRSVIIDDIFPYSVNNLPLTGQPVFARLWRWALRRKMHGPQIAGYLINIRNIWQLMISADKRYGPMFNQSVADVILHGLLRYKFDPSSSTPVFLIGYSGAAQIAVGSTAYLAEWIGGPIYIISLGGIFSSDPGVLAAEHVYHIYGTVDRTHRYSVLAPGRWPLIPASEWNRARRQGKVTAIKVGPIGHTGDGGYLDSKSELPDGTSFVDKTAQTVASIVQRSITTSDSRQRHTLAEATVD